MQKNEKHGRIPYFRLWSFLSQVYETLLYVYPSSFRQEYGEAMAQLFRDDTRESLRKGGLDDLMGCLFHTLVDLIITTSSEHMNKIIQSTKEGVMRWVALTCVSLILLSMVVGMANQEAIFGLIDLILTPGGLIVVAALRVVLGLALIIAADASRAPNTLRVIGGFFIIAGISAPILGTEILSVMLEGVYGNGLLYMRIGLAGGLMVFLLLLYALTPRRRLTAPPPETA